MFRVVQNGSRISWLRGLRVRLGVFLPLSIAHPIPCIVLPPPAAGKSTANRPCLLEPLCCRDNKIIGGDHRGHPARVTSSPPSKSRGWRRGGWWTEGRVVAAGKTEEGRTAAQPGAIALLIPGYAETHVVEPEARRTPAAIGRTGEVRPAVVPGTATKDTDISGVWAGGTVYGSNSQAALCSRSMLCIFAI